MKTKLFYLLLCVVLFACDRNKIFESYKDIKNNRWEQNNVVVFETEIEETSALYDIELALRHTSYYTWANLRVNFTIVYPGGSERTKDYNFVLRNEDGSFKGEGMGDLWDINFPLMKKISLNEKGKYIFKVQNIMPKIYTDDIMQIGLIIRKSTN